MKINKELVKGSTSILILSLLEREDMYGYQLVQRLALISGNVFELKEGTLYPMLHGLENEGNIEAYWVDSEAGRRRRYYRITEAGRALLGEKKKEWQIYSGAVNRVIGLSKGALCNGQY